ncbi:MAG TPA: saccharopine dehydrogenase NADP-binding domain-containing protein [Actinomycetota bacterium]|nr:saccharopine dehydrogenase NADP-binding domain-containing protein [Actinomycetota bacterium]
MPDIVLFGATGYTGRLTAQALARRGADFAIAGRNKAKLYALADEVGGPEVRVAAAGDVDALSAALEGARAMITTVGPFENLGETAVQAALRTGTNYIDSTGEGSFVDRLLARDQEARDSGICMAPCMGFDEVPGDVAATLATEEMSAADLVLTYAIPTTASTGTLRTVLAIMTKPGPWIENGRRVLIEPGGPTRWAPMPQPLGPKPSMGVPLAIGRLAPEHLDLAGLRIYATAGTLQRYGLRYALPLFARALETSWGTWALEKGLGFLPEGPDENARSEGRWTILAEASDGKEWRNVSLIGTDVYGLTAECLTSAAIKMSEDGFSNPGVHAPVGAVGLETLQKTLIDFGVSIETYEPRH